MSRSRHSRASWVGSSMAPDPLRGGVRHLGLRLPVSGTGGLVDQGRNDHGQNQEQKPQKNCQQEIPRDSFHFLTHFPTGPAERPKMSGRPGAYCGRDLWKIPADRRQRNGGWGGSCQASMVDIIAENTAVCNSEGKSESFKEKTGTSKSTPAGLGQSGAEHLRGPGRAAEARAHSLRVAPEVTTSSTRRTRSPARSTLSFRRYTPSTLARRSDASWRWDWGSLFRNFSKVPRTGGPAPGDSPRQGLRLVEAPLPPPFGAEGDPGHQIQRGGAVVPDTLGGERP